MAAAFLLVLLLQAAPPASAQEAPQGAEAFAEGPPDSLAFALKRRKILEGAPDVRMAALLEAAEDLARDGYYAEALELVYDLEDTALTAGAAEDFLADSLPGPGPLPPAAKPAVSGGAFSFSSASLRELRSYVRSSFEYDDWDDQPFGGEVRAKLEWLPEGAFLERVTPTFAGSDRRAFFGLAGRGSAFGRMLKVEAEGLAERKLWQAYGDSLDRISLQGVVEAGTRPLGRTIAFNLPLRGEMEEYREDRLGLLSRRTAGISPSLEAVSADWRRSLILTWDARWYSFPSAPSSGYFRSGPSLLGNWYGERFTAEGEAQYVDDRYGRDTSLLRSRAWDARIAAYIRPHRRVKAGVRLLHNAEQGAYRDTLRVKTSVMVDTVEEIVAVPVHARYDLEGSTSTVQPLVTVDWGSIYSATASLAYTRGRYPMLSGHGGKDLDWPQFIGEDYQGWKPEATFSILSKRLFLNLSLGYEMHQPAPSPYYFQGYSEGVGLGGNFSWKLSPWVEIDFSGTWRKRLDDKATPGQVQDMASVSAGLISRFR